MTDEHVLTANDVSPEALQEFLKVVYRPGKAEFLRLHGDWWHQGNENRWLIEVDDKIAAYCAIIPTKSFLAGEVQPALWWVDLIVLPEFRGEGLQHILDKKVREAADLKLGFPNELAAKIHLKHGWGVHDQIRYMILPLRPMLLKRVQESGGMRGLALKGAAFGLSILAATYRGWVRGVRAQRAFVIDAPDADILAAVFERTMAHQSVVTTLRDAQHIQWRYLDSPYRDELRFYGAGDPMAPSLIAITRTLEAPHGVIVRVLDIFGDTGNRSLLLDLVTRLTQDAVTENAIEIDAVVSLPDLISALRLRGFVLSVGSLFCWHSIAAGTMKVFAQLPGHWVFADSDNDELVF